MDNEKDLQNLYTEDLEKVSGGITLKTSEPTCNCRRLPGESYIGLCIKCKQRRGIALSEREKGILLSSQIKCDLA